MKIIHCADLHLDSKMDALSSEMAKLRREEILSTFEKMVSYASNNGVSIIIIAGDMFDTEKVTAKTRERVIRTIFNAQDITFLYLSGNHDDSSFLLDENMPENFKTFSNDWTYYTFDNVVIAGLVNENLSSDSFYDTLKLSEDNINIVTLHGQIIGHKGKDDAKMISLPRLKDKFIDYLALGHIHEYSINKLDLRGSYCYSGCLEGRGFDELGTKGFSLLTIENNRLTQEFVPFSTRQLDCIEFDVSCYENFYDATNDLISLLKSKFDSSSLIKIVLKGEHPLSFVVDLLYLKTKLKDLFFFSKIYDESTLKIDKDDFELDKSIKGEFVRAVLGSSLDEAEKDRVIMCGIKALKGEDL